MPYYTIIERWYKAVAVKKDKKTGKWYVRVSYKDADGKYKTKNKYGFTTKKEAQIVEAKYEMMKQEGIDLDAEKDMTIFANYFEDWCNTFRIGKFSTGTDKKYQHEIKLVKEFFGNTRLKDLTRTKYQKYINERGKDRSKNTVEKTHGYLKKCLSYALADGLITQDPTFGVELAYDIEEQDRVKYLDLEGFNKLYRHLLFKDSMNDLMLFIALSTGLRIGEVYGLAYDDIKEDSLTVNRGYDYQIDFDFTSGKTKSAKRTIVIPKELYVKVQKYRLQNSMINNKYLFLDPLNKPRITHNGLSKHLQKTLKQLKLPRVTIHVLRHTHASVLFYNKINIGYISKRLGHSNISETLNTYTHIISELEQTANEEIQSIFEVAK